MTDRYDPKTSARPAPGRTEADDGNSAAADPLFELARIVSGRGTGGSTAAVPSRQPAPPPAAEPAPPAAPEEPDVLGDLEAELLSDLKASFASVKQAFETPTEHEPQPQAPPPAAPAAASPPPPRSPAPEVRATRSEPSTPPPQPTKPKISAAARPPIQAAPPSPAAAPPPGQPASRSSGPGKVDISNLQLRATAAPGARFAETPPSAEKPSVSAAKPSRWDKPPEPPKPAHRDASRFAPPRAAAQAPPTAPPPTDLVDEEEPFGEGLPFGFDAGEAGEEFPLDDFETVPGYGEEEELPPYPEDDEAPASSRHRRVPIALVAVAGILAVVLIGIVSVVIFRSGGSADTTPPIIAAELSPTKVAPPAIPTTGEADQQNKLIYDRVDGSANKGNTAADTTLVTPGNQPIAPVPPSTDTNNPIAQVIAPEGSGGDQSGASDTTGSDVAMSDGNVSEPIGPRKVRTVIVRPDGTIVSSDAVPAAGDAPASTDAVPTPPETPQVPPVPPVASNDDTAAISGGTAGQELAITPVPGGSGNAAPVPTTQTPAPVAARTPTPAPAPRPTTQPKVVATGGDGGPIDLTPGRAATTTVASANPSVASANPGQDGAVPLVASGGMMVQISSQRSEDAALATFHDLQKRYASLLGGYEANIQRADLGARGIYFRVRVGPFASGDAQQLCSSLKSAGGDCILAPN